MQLHKIPLLETRRKLSRLTFLHKIMTGKITINVPCCVQPATARTTRRRHDRSLAPIFARTNAYKHSYFPRTVTDWNSLPQEIFTTENFVTSLENYLFGV